LDEKRRAVWSVEIVRRLRELDSGSVESIPWEEARRQILGSMPHRVAGDRLPRMRARPLA